mgnify:FL=1
MCEHILDTSEEHEIVAKDFEGVLHTATSRLQMGNYAVQPWRKALLEVFAKYLPGNISDVLYRRSLTTHIAPVNSGSKLKATRIPQALVYRRIKYLREPPNVPSTDDFSHVFCPDYVVFLEQAVQLKHCRQVGFQVYDLSIGDEDVGFRYVKIDLASRAIQISVDGWDYLVRLRPPFQETFKSSLELLRLLRVISKLTMCKERASIQCHILYRQDVEVLNTKYYKNTLLTSSCCSSCKSTLTSRMNHYLRLCKYPGKVSSISELFSDRVISGSFELA